MSPVDDDDPKSTARTNPSDKPGGATGGAFEGRVTRSRAGLQAAPKTGPKDPAQKGGRGVKRPIVGNTSGQEQKNKMAAAAAAAGGRSLSKEELKLAARPSCPTSGKVKDWILRKDAEGKLQKTPKIFHSDLPTITREVEDADTVESIRSLKYIDLAMDISRSVVVVSCTHTDGSVLFQCTGIIYQFDGATETAKVLTSSLICAHGRKLRHPELKVFVHLSKDTKVESRVLFFNGHYRVAFLQIVTKHALVPASLGSRPEYDENVFILGRDKDYHVIVRSGSILRLDQPFYRRIHYLFSSADSPVACIGGPVINKQGEVIGMISTHFTEATIISISTITMCIKMWCQFGRIIHPVHELDLKAVRLLDIYRRDELSVCHNIRRGFIVDKVLPESNAQKMGIRRGDVIDVMSPELGTTVFEFEDGLLKLGWQLLEKEVDLILHLEIKVHNLYDRESVRTVLPMRFGDTTVGKHDPLEFEGGSVSSVV